MIILRNIKSGNHEKTQQMIVRDRSEMWLKIAVIFAFYLISAFASSPRELSDVVAAGPSDPEGISFRLPNNTRPIHYEINLSTDIHLPSFSFNGSVFITLRTLMPSTNITLNFKGMTFSSITLYTVSLVQIYVDFEQFDETELLVITPREELPGDQSFILWLNYVGNLREDIYGFYSGFYVDEDGNDRYYAMTQFQPTDARHAFPW